MLRSNLTTAPWFSAIPSSIQEPGKCCLWLVLAERTLILIPKASIALILMRVNFHRKWGENILLWGYEALEQKGDKTLFKAEQVDAWEIQKMFSLHSVLFCLCYCGSGQMPIFLLSPSCLLHLPKLFTEPWWLLGTVWVEQMTEGQRITTAGQQMVPTPHGSIYVWISLLGGTFCQGGPKAWPAGEADWEGWTCPWSNCQPGHDGAVFTPPSLWWPKWELVAVPTALRPGMPCSWLLHPAALARCAWLAGAGIKAPRQLAGMPEPAHPWQEAEWVSCSPQPAGAPCPSLPAAPRSDTALLPVWFAPSSKTQGCFLLYKRKIKKNQLHRWLIVAQLYSLDSDIQFIFILQLILVSSSYRSWIQIYIFSLLELASCQENKHLLLSATLRSPKTNNYSSIVG